MRSHSEWSVQVNSRSRERSVGWDLVITKAVPHSDPRLLMTNLGISRSIVWNVRCHQFYYVARSIDPNSTNSLDITVSTRYCWLLSCEIFFSIFKIESSNFSSIGGKNSGKENLRKNKLLVQGNGGKNLKEQNGKRKKKKKKNNQTKSDSYLMAKLLKHPPCQKIIKWSRSRELRTCSPWTLFYIFSFFTSSFRSSRCFHKAGRRVTSWSETKFRK